MSIRGGGEAARLAAHQNRLTIAHICIQAFEIASSNTSNTGQQARSVDRQINRRSHLGKWGGGARPPGSLRGPRGSRRPSAPAPGGGCVSQRTVARRPRPGVCHPRLLGGQAIRLRHQPSPRQSSIAKRSREEHLLCPAPHTHRCGAIDHPPNHRSKHGDRLGHRVFACPCSQLTTRNDRTLHLKKKRLKDGATRLLHLAQG